MSSPKQLICFLFAGPYFSANSSSRDAWVVVREQTAAQATVHTLLAEELRTNVSQPLDVYGNFSNLLGLFLRCFPPWFQRAV